ncbi:DUF6274 family protein [Streptomyces parvus]|uniref:DUF6274 family protein n=1 Tax=Streptomyces parvus TaxID=66428 RepID=UPI00342871C6
MSASAARHETRALLRAHLAAASAYGHLTRHCTVCHRLLRLAMEPGATVEPERAPVEPEGAPEAATDSADAPRDAGGMEDERPPATRPSAG